MPMNSLKSKIHLPDFENQHYKRTELNWTLLENSSHEAKERRKQDTIMISFIHQR